MELPIFETTRQDPTKAKKPAVTEYACLQADWVPNLVAIKEEADTSLADAKPFSIWVRQKGTEGWIEYVCTPHINWVGTVAPEQDA